MREYIVTVEMTIKARNHHHACHIATRGLNEGVNDIGEIETANVLAADDQDPPTAPAPMKMLNGRRVRVGERWMIVGRCPMCGRNVTPSSANKTGPRCRYEGAQFNLRGELLSDAFTRSTKHKRTTRIIDDFGTRLTI